MRFWASREKYALDRRQHDAASAKDLNHDEKSVKEYRHPFQPGLLVHPTDSLETHQHHPIFDSKLK